MTTTYAPRTQALAANVVLEAAVRTARARLAGPLDPSAYYDANARTFLVAVSAVELIDGTAHGYCPHCQASMQGEPIPDKYRVHAEDCAEQVARRGRCFCFSYGDATHFGRQIGVEISGVYDGVLFYVCPDCNRAWPRWTDGGRLTDVAAQHVEQHNALVGIATGGAA